MSATGVKRAKAIETEPLEPTLFYHGERDWKELQARRLGLVWRLRKTPLRVFLIGCVLSLVIPFLIPKTYVATTQLMPPENSSNANLVMAAVSAKAGPLSGMATDLLNLKTSAHLFIGVMTSPKVEDQVVSQFDLKKVYRVKDDEEARNKLNEHTFIREDKNSGLIAISVSDHDPKMAADLANAYVDRLNTLMSEISTSSAHTERVFLEERLKLVKQDLDIATNRLAQFSSRTDTLDPQQQGKAMLDVAGGITAQLIAAQSQAEGLRQMYTDRHPRLKALNARIAELRKELERLGGNSDGVIAAGLPPQDGLQQGEVSPDSGYPTIRKLPLLGAKYTDYYRHIKIQETVYELLTGQYELAKVQEAKEVPTIKVLDVAYPPHKKASPNRVLLAMLGGCLSFGLASLCWTGAVLWQEVDPRDPRLMMARKVVGQMKAQLPWNASNRRESIGAPRREVRSSPADETFD